MASKKPPIENLRTLQSVAVAIRDLAILRAPRDTGYLKQQIKQANTPVKEKMIQKNKDGSVSIVLNPYGKATYGKYWNKPFGTGNWRTSFTAYLKKLYPKNYDYADKAITDPTLKQKFGPLIDELTKQVAADVAKQIKEDLQKK